MSIGFKLKFETKTFLTVLFYSVITVFKQCLNSVINGAIFLKKIVWVGSHYIQLIVNCCDPSIILSNSNAKQNHRKQIMSTKKRANETSVVKPLALSVPVREALLKYKLIIYYFLQFLFFVAGKSNRYFHGYSEHWWNLL